MSMDTLSPETVSRLKPDSLIKCKRGGLPNGDSFFATVASFDTDSGLLKIRASIHDDEEILIVGTRVDDFKMVRYDQIGAIMVAALQQYGDRIRKLEAMMSSDA
jgi:ribosomal protein S12